MADKNFAVKNGLTVANNLLLAENGKVSINASITPVSSLEINSTDGIKIPVGNTGQRPSGNSLQIGGVMRYNTDLGMVEVHTGSTWSNVVIGGNGTSSVTIAGSNTEIQFNDSTALGASANLRFDKATSTFTVGNTTVKTDITGNTLTVGNQFGVNATGFLRVGAVDRPYVFAAVKDGYTNAFFYGVHSNTEGTILRFHRTRASYAAQTVPQATDNLASFIFSGFTPTTSVKDVAGIRARATETFTDSAHGSEIIFSTSNTGANTLTDRLIISANDSVTVNGSLVATSNITTGNSTVNATINSIGFIAGLTIANQSGLYVGANVTLSSSLLRIGNSTVNSAITSTNLTIGAGTGTKIDLHSGAHAIGVQSFGTYVRVSRNFAVYVSGSHSDTELDSGGGTTILTTNSTVFTINARATFSGNITIQNGALFTNAISSSRSDAVAQIVLYTTNASSRRIQTVYYANATPLYEFSPDLFANNSQTFYLYNSIAGRNELWFNSDGSATFANIIVSTGLYIGNSTINTSVNSSTIYTTSAINVGSNASLSTSTLLIGNSTVNVTVNSSYLLVGGVNVVNSAGIYAGSNVSLDRVGSRLVVGNSTVNTTVNSIGYYAGITVANQTSIAVGSNVVINSSVILVGNSTVNATINSSVFALNGVAVGGGTGKQSIYIPAGAMISTTANGATLFLAEMSTTNNIVNALRFDGTTRKNAQFTIAMPKSWDEGTISFKYFWTANTTSTPGVTFAVEAVAVSDTDNINVAFGTAQYVSDTFQSNNKMHVSGESSAITVSGTPAEQDMIWLKVWRDVANTNDTMTANAELIGIMVYYTTNAGNDT